MTDAWAAVTWPPAAADSCKNVCPCSDAANLLRVADAQIADLAAVKNGNYRPSRRGRKADRQQTNSVNKRSDSHGNRCNWFVVAIRDNVTKSKALADSSVRTRLVARAQRGGITLVIGAGVSLSRGVPNWESLAKLLWVQAFGKRRSPWETFDAARSPRQVPQFLPIIFELAYRELGETMFLEALRKNLYSKVRYPGDDQDFNRSNESLAVIARLIVQEYKRASNRRIDAIITLNADDLIEQAVNTVAGLSRPPPEREIVRVVARPTHSHLGGPLRRPIPVYHIHGFVPSNHTAHYGKYFDHMLVFTDTQYWSTSAAGSTFANRVIGLR